MYIWVWIWIWKKNWYLGLVMFKTYYPWLKLASTDLCYLHNVDLWEKVCGYSSNASKEVQINGIWISRPNTWSPAIDLRFWRKELYFGVVKIEPDMKGQNTGRPIYDTYLMSIIKSSIRFTSRVHKPNMKDISLFLGSKPTMQG